MRILSIVAERLAYGIGLLVAVLVLNFFLIRLAPGDPVQFLIGEMGGASEEFVREIRRAMVSTGRLWSNWEFIF